MKRRRKETISSCSITGKCAAFFVLLSLFSPSLSSDSHRHLLGLRGVEEKTPSKQETNKGGNSKVPSAANVTVPLFSHSGTHHAHVYVGSPPQRQTLIVDTGSRVMAFPCKPCRTCGTHASPYFDPALSTTYVLSKCGTCLLAGISQCTMFGEECEVTQKYTEGSSWSANEGEDMVWLGTPDISESTEELMVKIAVPYAFGCQTTSKGLFHKQYADGILGLARHETSLIAAFSKAQAIPRNAFSMCMTKEGGHLSIGGSLPKHHHVTEMKMTPITREHGWYSVEVVNILVGKISIVSSTTDQAGKENSKKLLKDINGGKGCIFDSGTTDTYLPKSLEKVFSKAASDWTNGLTDFSEKSREKLYTFADFQKLPEITFLFKNNVTIAISPGNYMEGVPIEEENNKNRNDVKPWEGTKMLTNRVYLEEKEGTVLGANAMFGHDILYDVQGHQVGIAKAHCEASVHSAVASKLK